MSGWGYAAGLLGCVGLWVVPAQAQSSEFRCQAGAGRSESSILGTADNRGSVVGQISVSKMLMHPRYRAVGEVNFIAVNGSWKARLDVLGFPRVRRNQMVARLRIERDGKEQVFSLGDLAPGAVLPFQLSLTDGRVIAKLGKKTAEADVPVSPFTVRAGCSTATVLFAGLHFSQ
jgi:hypothetical protein